MTPQPKFRLWPWPPFLIFFSSAQNFSVVLDTGSADLWLADTSCTTCSRTTKLFDTTASSTYRASSNNVVITYGSGRAAGSVAQDTVSMGGFVVPNQTFRSLSNTLYFLNMLFKTFPSDQSPWTNSPLASSTALCRVSSALAGPPSPPLVPFHFGKL